MSSPILDFNAFFRRVGIKSDQYLMAPRMPSTESFAFPKDSIHHYVVYDGVSKAPSSDEYYYRDIQKKIFVHHVTDLAETKGQPRKQALPIVPLIKEFHRANRRFRLAERIETVKDENTLLTINYGFAAVGYRYTKSFFAEYFKWYNIEKTLWKKLNEITKENTRQNFIFVNLPKTLPSLSRLNMFSDLVNQEFVKRFNTPEYLFVLELWKWLSVENRSKSIIGDMPNEQLKKINIVFEESGRFILLNLGEMDSWRVSSTIPNQKIKMEPETLQKRFLKMLMTHMQNRSVVDGSASDDVEEFDPETGSVVAKPFIEEPTTLTDTDSSLIPEGKSDYLNLDKNGNEDSEKTKAEKIKEMIDSLDEDLQALEVIESQRDEAIILDDEDIEGKVNKEISISHADKAIEFSYFNKELSPEERIVNLCNELAEDGLMSANEYRKITNSAGSYLNLPSPYDPDQTLGEFGTIKPEDVLITESAKTVDRPTIIDKSMLSSSLIDFDERYIKNILPKDTVNMVTAIQSAGLIINRYEVEPVEDILGKFEMHTVRVSPVQGQPSTLRFKIPIIDEDGTFQSNGVRYRMRKQKGEIPIRKVAPDKVSLTSYYGKSTVSRSDKKVNDFGAWLRAEIISKGIDSSDTTLTNLTTGDVFVNNIDLPRSYTSISMGVRGFSYGGFDFSFDYDNREKIFGKDNVDKYEQKGNTIVAESTNGEFLILDQIGSLYKTDGDDLDPIGTIESFIGLDLANAPTGFAQIKIYGKNIPLVLVLGYMYGLETLINVLRADVRRVSSGQRQNLQPHEYAITFSDETLIFNKDDTLATIIFAGFKDYAKHIRSYSVYTFDKPNVYLNVLDSNNVGVRYLREIDLMDKMFIDPITKEILIEMKEPTTFRGLIVRAAQLLIKDAHPDSLDMAFMRIKGYERISGAIYAEMVNSIRDHNSKTGKSNAAIEMHPYAIWKRITEDPSKILFQEINPIEDLKQSEAITYSGVGGRMARSMTKASRAYHPNDMGVISESTSDSSDVAINTYSSADPQFVSLRGRTKKYDFDKPNHTSLLSTSALLAVGSDSDDPKRVNFISIQNSHIIACDGYTQAAVRTGYEQVIGQRTSDLFSYAARQDGKVISKKDTGIVIEYADGTKKGIQLGRRYGSSGGLTIAHSVVSKMEVGTEFKKGDIVAYNEGFFEPDILNPSNVILKTGTTARTVLWESSETHEDASSISRALADKLSTKVTKVKQVVVQFDQHVSNIIAPGTKVEHRTILCTIEDAITSNAGLFDESTLSTLRMFSNQTPQAKTKGVLEKIEIFYNGEKEDMNPSLRKLADAGDRALASSYRSVNKRPLTGQVDESYRIDGDALQIDHLVIKFYLTSDVTAAQGDKGVFANQMKTVFSQVMDYEMITESGEVIDAVFGQKSIDDRIVLSAPTIGTTTTLLDVIAKQAVKIYEES